MQQPSPELRICRSLKRPLSPQWALWSCSPPILLTYSIFLFLVDVSTCHPFIIYPKSMSSPFSPWNKLFQNWGTFAVFLWTVFSVLQNSHRPPHRPNGSNCLRSTADQTWKHSSASEMPVGLQSTLAVTALMLVCKPAFPVALLSLKSFYYPQVLIWVGWSFSFQNESKRGPPYWESAALRIKTNDVVPSALMSLSLFLLFRKWNALAPNSSQCWLCRAPLLMFWAH